MDVMATEISDCMEGFSTRGVLPYRRVRNAAKREYIWILGWVERAQGAVYECVRFGRPCTVFLLVIKKDCALEEKLLIWQ